VIGEVQDEVRQQDERRAEPNATNERRAQTLGTCWSASSTFADG
jgi:hypothetical protein